MGIDARATAQVGPWPQARQLLAWCTQMIGHDCVGLQLVVLEQACHDGTVGIRESLDWSSFMMPRLDGRPALHPISYG